uniref:PBPe domain-containing protein n=1 Tax=Macrostomum lignano TaxID=282301 RepID=A0A1I8HLH3_9PLAT
VDYSVADEIWLQEYIWSAVGSFMQQGQDFYPFSMSPRITMAFWWMFTVVIYASYTGDLTAHLTVTVTDVPIKTLSDLVSQSYIKPYVESGSNLETLMLEAKSGIYKQIAERMVIINEVCTTTWKPDQACLGDYTPRLASAMRNCSLYYLAEEHFNTATIAFVYPDDAFYASLMDF